MWKSVVVRGKSLHKIFIGSPCAILQLNLSFGIKPVILCLFPVPELRIVIPKEMDHVELQFDGRNDGLPSVCIQYEQDGTCPVSVIRASIWWQLQFVSCAEKKHSPILYPGETPGDSCSQPVRSPGLTSDRASLDVYNSLQVTID